MGSNSEALREMVRSIVKEELRKLLHPQVTPTVSPLATVIRDEVRYAILQAEPEAQPARLEKPLQERRVPTYADALRQPVVHSASFAAPTRAKVTSACLLSIAKPSAFKFTNFKLNEAPFNESPSGKLKPATWGGKAADNTVIADACPKIPRCPSTKFRSADGLCNNLQNREWGKSLTAYERFLPPTYADVSNGSAITCCDPQLVANPTKRHFACMQIDLPPDDRFYGQFQQNCLEFVRSVAAPRPKCAFGRLATTVFSKDEMLPLQPEGVHAWSEMGLLAWRL
ncbi:hypothetical protein HPB52_018729 [Rhipicephalus sanguineus]|uniref:Uncharacterized protein n=1 Tax=Rhipicephalus sanguineus TaxID=34632 RepID=A0A9D4TB78_RHISA|nr:hypothetical protein HPB52_018729 [Rhipicephalus sanguineus]